MYHQVVARPAYPKVYSMGLSIIKTQVGLQNMHEKNQKKEIETSHNYDDEFLFKDTVP